MDYADLISEHDFAQVVGLSIWGVRAWRRRGYGPSHKKLGKRVFYSRREIGQFLSSGSDT